MSFCLVSYVWIFLPFKPLFFNKILFFFLDHLYPTTLTKNSPYTLEELGRKNQGRRILSIMEKSVKSVRWRMSYNRTEVVVDYSLQSRFLFFFIFVCKLKMGRPGSKIRSWKVE